MFKYITLFMVALLAIQCTNSTTTTQETSNPTESTSTTDATPTPAPSNVVLDTFPSIQIEKLQHLWENCDYIDYVFYEMSFSMSMEEKQTVQYILSQIAADPAPKKPECKPIGRIFFQVKGENYLEADLFFSNGCTYYLFLEDGKPKYGNYMTPLGVQYLNNTFQKASGQ